MNQDASIHSFIKPGVEGLLSPLLPWLSHPDISELMINEPGCVFVEEKGVMTCHSIPSFTPIYLQRLFQMIANESNQILDEAHPLLSGTLYNGLRVQCVIPPVSKHHVLAIRKESTARLSLGAYTARGFFDSMRPFHLEEDKAYEAEGGHELMALYQAQQWPEFIKVAIQQRKNIIISGGTSSGKTTFLKACLEHIDHEERIILLEDTRELTLPHSNHISLLASKGNQGKAAVSMQVLVQASLRLRPDRLIMGEIRGAEIMDFIAACSTGHEGSLTSIHANNPLSALHRMVGMYKLNNVPSMTDKDILGQLDQVIDVIIQLHRTKGRRQATCCYYKGAHAMNHLLQGVGL